jgi:glycosyltransferase involved in cell wall biosynthesis
LNKSTPKPKIVHLTTAHRRDDTRIFLKEVRTLAQTGQWTVILMVADGKGPDVYVNDAISVEILDMGKLFGGRLGRMVIGNWRAFGIVRNLNVDVIHFHDPELIIIGIVLKLLGYKVIYDVHENVPLQILSKYWLPPFLRPFISRFTGLFEKGCAKLLDAVVPATLTIAKRYPNHKTILVQNFPLLSELFLPDPGPYKQRPLSFAYVGTIAKIRGAREMVQAVNSLSKTYNVRLELAGHFSPDRLEEQLQILPSWNSVFFHGHLSRSQVAFLLGRVRAGLVLFYPEPNHIHAQPNKMFEYMAAGLPVIASDFPHWREIIQGAGCGLLVDPKDPEAIAAAMKRILDHPEEAEAMGQRGRGAVEMRYNWERESVKLLEIYERLLCHN